MRTPSHFVVARLPAVDAESNTIEHFPALTPDHSLPNIKYFYSDYFLAHSRLIFSSGINLSMVIMILLILNFISLGIPVEGCMNISRVAAI